MFPRSGLGLARPEQGKARKPSFFPRFQRRHQFRQRRWTSTGEERQIVTVSSLLRPPWMWVGYFWFQSRIAWWFWMRAPRPTLRVSVGLSATTAFWAGEDADGLRHIRIRRDSDLVMAAWGKYVAQRMSQWVSREARATSLLLRCMLISQLYLARAPWRHWEGSRISHVIFRLYAK